jgi:hypothetical protein
MPLINVLRGLSEDFPRRKLASELLGPWRPSELLACRQACYPRFAIATVLMRYAQIVGLWKLLSRCLGLQLGTLRRLASIHLYAN